MPLEKRNFKEETVRFVKGIPLMTPKEIEQQLRSNGYIGQGRAVKASSLMAYRHIKRIKNIYVEGAERETLPPKTNMLFVGPTGCGKTYLVELLFEKILKLPTLIIDITGYSETGYVGQDASFILTHLLYVSDFNPVTASLGIVCLDEFDKLSSGQNNALFAGAGTTKDVSGLGVQRELLKMLETAEIPVPLDLSHADYAPKTVISTADITFIGCGAFSGLKGMINENNGEHIGFGRNSLSKGNRGIAVNYSIEEIEPVKNFQQYGFLPELIGRFKRVIPFHALNRSSLNEILRKKVLKQYENEFALDGISLEIDDEVIQTVIDESLKKETGARGLESTLVRILEDASFEAFSKRGVKEVKLFLKSKEIKFKLFSGK